jgi:sugar-phosphatase
MPVLPCAAVLFDLDGVLVDSHPTIERILRSWAVDRGIDPDHAVAASQGRRDIDLVAIVAPHLDAAAEAAELVAREEEDFAGLHAIPGAAELVDALPATAWAVVTSGSRNVAAGRLKAVGLPVPAAFVTAEDVSAGKPDPECYLRGAWILGVDPRNCVVFEDAVSGLKAARAAGMRTVAVGAAGESAPSLWDARVNDLRDVVVAADGTSGGLRIQVSAGQ